MTERVTIGTLSREQIWSRGIGVVMRHLEKAGLGQLAESLSFFELLVALAYSEFAARAVDAAVVGGRWDATNLIDTEVAVLSPIPSIT